MKKRYETVNFSWIAIGEADILTVSNLTDNGAVFEDGSSFNELFQ